MRRCRSSVFAHSLRCVPFGLVLWISLGSGCKDSKEPGATRDECTRAAEHIAELIIADKTAHTDEWWDEIHEAGGPTGLPDTLGKSTFGGWLDSPEGKTWLMQRRGNTLTGVQQAIDPCVQNATRAQVRCLLSAKSKEEVAACDQKYARKVPPAGAGGADPTAPAAGSAGGDPAPTPGSGS